MKKSSEKNTAYIRSGILVAAIAFTGIGLAGREHLEVLGKAVKVCLECIGIG